MHPDSSAEAMKALYSRVAALEDELRVLRGSSRGPNPRWRSGLIGALLLTVGGAVTAVAQTSSDVFRPINAGEPARAADLTWNLNLLKAWIEQKVGTAGNGTVTVNGLADLKSGVKYDCNACGSPSTLAGTDNYGDLTIQGRVLSASSNIHLSPPGGANVVISDDYRAAGGTAGTPGAGLTVQGSVAIARDLSVSGNTWGAGPTSTAVVSKGPLDVTTDCPNGEYVCGVRFFHNSGDVWYLENYQLRCCKL